MEAKPRWATSRPSVPTATSARATGTPTTCGARTPTQEQVVRGFSLCEDRNVRWVVAVLVCGLAAGCGGTNSAELEALREEVAALKATTTAVPTTTAAPTTTTVAPTTTARPTTTTVAPTTTARPTTTTAAPTTTTTIAMPVVLDLQIECYNGLVCENMDERVGSADVCSLGTVEVIVRDQHGALTEALSGVVDGYIMSHAPNYKCEATSYVRIKQGPEFFDIYVELGRRSRQATHFIISADEWLALPARVYKKPLVIK